MFDINSRVKVVGPVPPQLYGEFGVVVAIGDGNDCCKVLLDRNCQNRDLDSSQKFTLAYWFHFRELQLV